MPNEYDYMCRLAAKPAGHTINRLGAWRDDPATPAQVKTICQSLYNYDKHTGQLLTHGRTMILAMSFFGMPIDSKAAKDKMLGFFTKGTASQLIELITESEDDKAYNFLEILIQHNSKTPQSAT